MTKSKTNVEESIIGLCNILAKQGNMVGEGGREEHVSVTPRGSTGHSGGGGGRDRGGDVFNIYLDGQKIDSFTRNNINKFQSVMK